MIDNPKIGLSLSFCVRDLVRGTVALPEVATIFTGTRFGSIRDEAIAAYSPTCWRGLDPVKITEVIDALLDSGRLVQLKEHGLEPVSIHGGHWAVVMGLQQLAVL